MCRSTSRSSPARTRSSSGSPGRPTCPRCPVITEALGRAALLGTRQVVVDVAAASFWDCSGAARARRVHRRTGRRRPLLPDRRRPRRHPPADRPGRPRPTGWCWTGRIPSAARRPGGRPRQGTPARRPVSGHPLPVRGATVPGRRRAAVAPRLAAQARASRRVMSSSDRVSDAAPMFSVRCSTDLVPGIGRMTGRLLQQPGQRHLGRRRAELAGDVGDRAVRCGEVTGGDREPRDEGDVLGGRVVEDVLALPVGQVVEVLHADDVDDLARRLQLLDRDLGDADVADLALVLQLLERAELVGQRDLRVDAVQLEEVDPVDLQVPQRELDLLGQVGGAADTASRCRARCGSGPPSSR